jgi:hypothetical protein
MEGELMERRKGRRFNNVDEVDRKVKRFPNFLEPNNPGNYWMSRKKRQTRDSIPTKQSLNDKNDAIDVKNGVMLRISLV